MLTGVFCYVLHKKRLLNNNGEAPTEEMPCAGIGSLPLEDEATIHTIDKDRSSDLDLLCQTMSKQPVSPRL